MPSSMTVIDEQIKSGNFANAYLLYGEEKYLLRFYKNKLINALGDPTDSMNFTRFDGKNLVLEEVFDLADTVPFFADRRVLLLSDTDLFASASEELIRYLGRIPKQTVLLFVESHIDARKKAYKTMQQVGCVVEFPFQNEQILKKWVLTRIKKERNSITNDAWMEFYNRLPKGMDFMEMELYKLLAYTAERDVITRDDVDAVCIKSTESKVYDMVDAALTGNIKGALTLYHDLLANKENPIQLLTPFLQKLDEDYLYKSLAAEGLSAKDIAKKSGKKDWMVGRGLSVCKNLSNEQLRDLLSEASKTHYLATTGGMDPGLAIETLLVSIYHGGKQKEPFV